MNEQPQISEEELHSYVDGSLAAHRREEIDRLLETNDELAARVSDYFSLNNMFHERYDRVLNEPVPARLRPSVKRSWHDALNWPQFAAMAATLVLGVGIGVGTNMGRQAATVASGGAGDALEHRVSADGAELFARQSAIAHVMYAPEVMRPVEVGVDREQELVTWVSNRMGTNVRPPILTRTGFELMGGRLLPGSDGPVAQFMYHDAKGERITLCISHRKVSADTTAFKLYQDGPVNVFYWVDGDFGYAVSGGIDRKALLELSHDVYAQLTANGTAPSSASALKSTD
ncbi:anti-sigma factor family protein [Paraburkholderia sp. GAS42]|jgi:anti-sigma factor RsiW|uniref:anti-sigma factor family protein n=1 Tax=Paraburkholderia sp. GAS42 TaxID=3035135 RepID=UPI003D1D01E8